MYKQYIYIYIEYTYILRYMNTYIIILITYKQGNSNY